MLVMVFLVFIVHVLNGRPPIETLLFSVALAVGLSPELLPAILSVNLARGAQMMARHGVLVRHLTAIENLGSMDVLCTDKTGTLTEGVVRARRRVRCRRDRRRRTCSELGAWNAALETGLASPLDDAILSAARAGSVDAFDKLAEIPFDFVRKRVSVVVETDGRTLADHQGRVSPRARVCTRSADGACARRRGERRARGALSKPGARRAFACSRSPSRPLEPQPAYGREVERDLDLRRLPHVLRSAESGRGRRAFANLARARRVRQDHHRRQQARHAARRRPGRLAGRSRAHRSATCNACRMKRCGAPPNRTDLFVEVDPNQKERIILALKKMGHVVGFLGDGVNDAPAMHAADTSLSVEQAVDVAKAAADFVLLERSLDVIRRGIEEGRKTFANTLKYVLTTMSANLGNMISMAAASLFLPFLPLLAGQILLNNLLSDVPAIGIADDAVDPELIERPQRWNMRFIGRFMVEFGVVSSVFDFLTFGALLLVFRAGPALFRTGWFVESLLTELVDRAGRADAAALLPQPARPGAAVVDRGAHRADVRHSLSAIHRCVRVRAVAGPAARHRVGDHGAVCRRHRTDQRRFYRGVL